MLTFANLFAGFTAIIHISMNEFESAALFILMASIFDALDGFAARLVNATSQFGVELDSLCDAVSFGVAPAFMLYQVHFYQYGEIGILLASLPALAGVARLASFNVTINGFDDKEYFKGLPIPAAALSILSYIIFYHLQDNFLNEYKDIALIIVTLLISFVMITKIKFDNLPRPNKNQLKSRPLFLVFTVIAISLTILSKGKLIFPLMLFYISWGILRYIYEYFTIPEDIDDDLEDSDEKETFDNSD